MPIVGIFRRSVTFRAASDGTHSSTSEKHPASSSSRACEARRSASGSVRACTLIPPSRLTDWGVRPRCPISGVPVMGHLGLTPQSVNLLGGMRVQARTDPEADLLASQARELEEAGCFSLVLECVPSEAARKVTDLLKIPTIGIGAGPRVSGQVLVYQDLLGLNPGFKPKFLRTYANAFDIIEAALNAYDQDVKSGNFPNDSESYSQIHQLNLGVA